MSTRVYSGALALALLGACVAPVDDVPAADDEAAVAASSEELINGTTDVNNPARNAALWVGGCSGTLVAPDIVITAAHCLVGAAWEDEPDVGIGTWRPMAPRDIRVGPDPANPVFQTWSYWMNVAGFDDVAIILLAQPVPSRWAIPARVMTEPEYERHGGTLAGKRLQFLGYGSECSGRFANRAWGWATFTGGTPRGVNTFTATLDPRTPQPLGEGGDSGGSLLWYDGTERVFYLVGVFQGTTNPAWDGCGSLSGTRATLELIAPWKSGDDDGKPDISAWLEGEVSQNLRRSHFQPAEGQDRWHGWFCVGDEECDVGDFDGDGQDDVITFVKSSYGDVHVGLSYGWRTWSGASVPQAGRGFESSLWHGFFGIYDENVGVMDFDGDGKDDIFAGSPWNVWIALSDGERFGSSWAAGRSGICAPGSRQCLAGNPRWGSRDSLLSIRTDTGAAELWYPSGTRLYRSSFDTSAITGACVAPAHCQLADFDGDLDDDLFIFRGDSSGHVDVAISSSGRFQAPVRALSSRCYDFGGSFRRDCRAADVDGDGSQDDIVMFDRYYRRVHVATREGSSYVTRYHWTRNVCADGHVCSTGDFNGDGLDDVVGFAKSSGGSESGDVYVQSSTYSF